MANEVRDAFRQTYRDFVVDGVPSSGAHNINKKDARSLGDVLQTQLQAAAAGNIAAATWAQLVATPGARVGQPGTVPVTDTGTHTDPVVGVAVKNSGEYRWSGSAWQRTGDVNDPAKTLAVRANLSTEDLDTVTAVGIYRQPLDSNVTSERHYPDTRAGVLEVTSVDNIIIQQYTTWFGKKYWRTKSGTFAWQGWYDTVSAAVLTSALANALVFRANLTTEDLDVVTATGEYRQVLDADATLDRHYPDGRAGILEVRNKDGLVTQDYTTWFGKKYWRTKYGSFAWQGWYEVARPTDIVRPYAGKTIAWIGDSIVEGNSYPTMIGANLGATVHKFGFGSCTMAKNAGSPNGYDKMTMYRFAKAIATGDWSDVTSGAQWVRDNTTPSDDNTPQVAAMAALDWSTVDYMVIAFGTNDWAGSTPLGSALTPDENGETFMGALAYAIETIQSAFPKIQIMLVGMSWRTRYFNVTPEINSDTWADGQGKYLVDYQDAILDAGNKYYVPAKDHYRTSGINLRTYGQYLYDGVHPSATGVALWVKKISGFLLAS